MTCSRHCGGEDTIGMLSELFWAAGPVGRDALGGDAVNGDAIVGDAIVATRSVVMRLW